jgi:hypothetical protein
MKDGVGAISDRRATVLCGMNMISSPDRLRSIIREFADFDFDSSVTGLEDFRSPAIVFSRQYWESARKEFTIQESTILAKALTVLEREFDWTGGCGAAAVWIVKDLLDRQPEAGNALARWIRRHTKNGYLRLACDPRAERRTWVGDLHHQS